MSLYSEVTTVLTSNPSTKKSLHIFLLSKAWVGDGNTVSAKHMLSMMLTFYIYTSKISNCSLSQDVPVIPFNGYQLKPSYRTKLRKWKHCSHFIVPPCFNLLPWIIYIYSVLLAFHPSVVVKALDLCLLHSAPGFLDTLICAGALPHTECYTAPQQ